MSLFGAIGHALFGGGGDNSSYTSNAGSPGGAVPVGTLAYQAITPSQNSHDQYLRSLLNYGGQQSQNFIGQGNTLMNTGSGYVAPAASYWQNLLSGNPAAMSQAIQPETNAISGQFTNARNQLSTYGPMGGGRAAQMSQLPFQQSGLISNLLAQVRPQAAQNLASLGLNTQQLGLGSQQLGANTLNQVLQNMLEQRGQDITERGQNKSLAGSLAAPFAKGAAGLIFG